MLMYHREYRSFFHIGLTYGISEVQCWRIVTTTEKLLLQSKAFRLPGKKKLHQSERQWQAVVVDVSEHPIERPKKTAALLLRQKEKTYPEKPVINMQYNQRDYLHQGR